MERLSARVKVNEQGRIVLPAALRCQVGIKPGDTIIAVVEGDKIVLQTREGAIRELQELFAAAGPSDVLWSDELIAERRAEAAREAAE